MLEPQPEHESMEFEVKPQLPEWRGKKVSLAALGLGALIVVGVIAAVAIQGAAVPKTDPAAQMMPSKAVVYASLTTHPDQQPDCNAVADA